MNIQNWLCRLFRCKPITLEELMIQITKLAAEVDVAIAVIANAAVLKGQVDALTSTVAAYDISIADLQGKIAAAEAELAKDQASIDDLTAKLTAALAPKP